MFNFFIKNNELKNQVEIKSNVIKNYEKKIKDLTKSRNKWKEKAVQYKQGLTRIGKGRRIFICLRGYLTNWGINNKVELT